MKNWWNALKHVLDLEAIIIKPCTKFQLNMLKGMGKKVWKTTGGMHRRTDGEQTDRPLQWNWEGTNEETTRRALGRVHTSALQCLIHENISGPIHFWDIVLYIVLSPNISMVMNHLKNSRSRIWIRIFTKIETILPCHTPNLSTKFCSNPSTTFWDIVLYIVFGPISQWWRIT